MSKMFWLRRFLLDFCVVFTVIISSHLLCGHALVYALSESTLWAVIAANIFVISRMYQSRKGQYCLLRNDMPEHLDSR